MNRKFLEFSRWGHFDYHEQIVGYFATVRELPSTDLNPKFGITNGHVTTFDIAKMFESKYSSFKTTNPYLHVDTKKAFVKLYWKIYGSIIITNIEFMLWIVKGYIAKLKGHLVNWAMATVSTAK
jgi:hypothetical protein